MFTTPDRDEVYLAIGGDSGPLGLLSGSNWRFWNKLAITMGLDTYWSCSFRAPFEHGRQEFRDTFQPFSFKPLNVSVGGDVLFSGTMVDILPRIRPNERSVDVTGYALPARLADCTAAAANVPLEFENATLRQIMEALGNPFGLDVEFRDDDGAPFKRVALEPSKKIHPFLAELAKQRNLVISNTPEGALLCWRSVEPGNPVARLEEGLQPTVSVTPRMNTREYFSEITGFTATQAGVDGAKYTERNPWLTDVDRPFSFDLEDIDPEDGPAAVRAKLGRMFANALSWTVDGLPTWRDPQGDLWKPNTTITLKAPDAFIYRETEFIVRSATLKRDDEEKTASLEIVLPGAFTGEVPDEQPWDA